ncbi:MAG: glycosyltransferase family 29 protein [Bdellovibrionota bacterium]
MQLLSPHDLPFKDVKRIAVVGNAASVLHWRAGSQIEASDLVVRFNEARTKGFETSVGQRTDILFANFANNLSKSPPPRLTLNPRYIVCLLTARDRDTRPDAFLEWANGCPVLFSWAPDVLPDPKARRARNLTTGLYALYLIREWFRPESLFVTGFSAFGNGDSGHYWKGSPPPAIFFHELDREAQYLGHILRGYAGKLELTPEVDAVMGKKAASAKRPLSKKIGGRVSKALLDWGTRCRRYSEAF